MSAALIAVTWLGGAVGSLELAAATAVSATRGRAGAEASLLIELADRKPCRPTILSSPSAREIEQALEGLPGVRAAARGPICHLRLPADGEWTSIAGAARAALPDRALCVLHCPPGSLRALLESADLRPHGALLRADLELDRSLAALAVADLRARGIRARIAKRPLAWFAGRLALAGLPPADAATRTSERLLSGLLGERRNRGDLGSSPPSASPAPRSGGDSGLAEDDHVMLGSFYGHYPDEERA